MYNVHNTQYNAEPRGINCMSYESENKKLALSRSDASIEIWNLGNSPYIERTIPNKSVSSIEALCWFAKRLFSTGLSASLIEYDLKSLSHKYAVPITGGVGWCMDIDRKSKRLIIGTEQGYLNLYNIQEDGVEYEKVLDKQEGRILCLKFHAGGEFVATGSANTVRIWNVTSGHAIHRMNLSRVANNTETLVWCLLITDNFTVISGDSRGFITFWDGELGTQIESCQSHSAAVLSICLSDDKKTIYCAGVEPLIRSYELVLIKDKAPKWVRSTQRKLHDHDVRCLVYADKRLYSAGVDGYLACSYPPKTLIKYPPLLQNPCVAFSREKDFFLLRYHSYMELWQFGVGEDDDDKDNCRSGTLLKLKQNPKKILRLDTRNGEGTLCAAISDNGQFIAYSTISRFKLFHFHYEETSDEKKPELTLFDSIPDEIGPCVRMEFTLNNKQLILVQLNGDIKILTISYNQVFLTQSLDTSNYLKDTIAFLSVSASGDFFVVADPCSNIVVFNNYQENNWRYYMTLPQYDCSPTALNIHPLTNQLVVAYSDHKIVEYNLVEKKFSDFSRSLNDGKPRNLLHRSFPITNISFEPTLENIILLQDDGSICVIDKHKKLPAANAKIPKLDSSAGLGASDKRIYEHAFHVIKRSKHLVYFGWISSKKVLSVEVDPLKFLTKLPAPFQKEKFGKK